MPDLKISQLPLASTPLAGTELVPIVQGGTTDQTTVEAILTGTVPSGTANGVLYLNGSKVVTSGNSLFFDGTIFRVGNGTVNSVARINGLTTAVQGQISGSATWLIGDTASALGSGTGFITFVYGNNPAIWYLQNIGEAMRLNPSGNLGIGTNNPARKLDVNGGIRVASANPIEWGGATAYITGESSTNTLFFGTSGSERMRLDSSGNLGLGVTPSAWTVRVLQTPSNYAFGALGLSNNGFFDGGWKYLTTAAATLYQSSGGTHAWYNAASGIANNAITFTQAMTLDSSGRLGIGVTNPSYRLDVVGSVSTAKLGKLAVKDDSPFITGANIEALGSNLGIGSTGANFISFFTNNLDRMRLQSSGGLSLGNTTDPGIYTLSVGPRDNSDNDGSIRIDGGGGSSGEAILTFARNATAQMLLVSGPSSNEIRGYSSIPMTFWTNNSEKMRLDASGNLGLGVTPSAWTIRALQIVGGASIAANSEDAYIQANAFYDGNWKYVASAEAAQYAQFQGSHRWYTAPSGTAGNTITFTQAMILDANGNLGLTTTPNSTWSASFKAIQTSAQPVLVSAGANNTLVAANWYSDGTDRYYANGSASRFIVVPGSFAWQIAGAGTANNAVSFTQAMTLDSSGRLLLGQTSGSNTLSVTGTALFISTAANAGNGRIALGVAGNNNRPEFSMGSSGQTQFVVNNIGYWAIGTVYSTGTDSDIGITTNSTERMRVTTSGNVVINTAAIATNATDGFLYVPTCAGTPTGTPTTYTGRSPIVVDTTNNKLYFYSGGAWRDAGP